MTPPRTRGGLPIDSAAVPRLHARDFHLATHLGIVLEIYDETGVGLVTGTKAPVNRLAYMGGTAGGFALPGYTAQVLIVDDGLRRPFQVLNGVIVTQSSPDTRIRPRPTTLESLDEKARIELEQGMVPFDWPLDRLNGDWCVVGYLGGSEQKPYVLTWWPSRQSALADLAEPTTDPDSGGGSSFPPSPAASHEGNAESVTVRAGVVSAVYPDGTHFLSTAHGGHQSGVRAPHTGGHMIRQLKPGGEIRIQFGEERGQSIVLRRGDQGPVLEIGLGGGAGREVLLLGRRFLRFFASFRAAVLAKFQALERRIHHQDRRYLAHHHHTAWGPTSGGPFSTPPLAPDEPTDFAPAPATEPVPGIPGAKPVSPPLTSADAETTAHTLPEPQPYDVLSGAVVVPDADLLRFEDEP